MPQENTNTATLLKRVFMFLEDEEWNRADEYCEKVLDIDPECAHAYIGKLMAELCVRTQEDLKNCSLPFDKNNNYIKAVRFSDEELKNTLVDYVEHINIRNENARLDEIYNRAKSEMLAATTEEEYKKAADFFASIHNYKDAVSLSSVHRQCGRGKKRRNSCCRKNKND